MLNNLIPSIVNRLSLDGDILRWDRETWELRSPFNRSDLEILDFEKDVCANFDKGLLMVPQKMNFGESVHTCKKLSGNIITYVDKARFDEYVYFLSSSRNMKSSACMEPLDETNQIEVWTGGSDGISEGKWTTWDTFDNIQVIISIHYCFLFILKVIQSHNQLSLMFSIYLGEKIDPTVMENSTIAL